MARTRAALLGWALALAASASAAPFTLVANVVSHAVVRAGGVQHPQPQVEVQCPEHPGLRCSSSVHGHQVLINVFHDPSTIVNRWPGGGSEMDHEETTDTSVRDESNREETIEDDVPNIISNWNSGRPDRVLSIDDASENDEDFGTPETSTESGEKQQSNEYITDEDNMISQGENDRTTFNDGSTEDSARNNLDSEIVTSSHERNDDYGGSAETNDATTRRSLDTASENVEEEPEHRGSVEEDNYDNNEDNDSRIETATHDMDIASNENMESDESNQNYVDDIEEGRSRDNLQDMVTTSKPLLEGNWWPFNE